MPQHLWPFFGCSYDAHRSLHKPHISRRSEISHPQDLTLSTLWPVQRPWGSCTDKKAPVTTCWCTDTHTHTHIHTLTHTHLVQKSQAVPGLQSCCVSIISSSLTIKKNQSDRAALFWYSCHCAFPNERQSLILTFTLESLQHAIVWLSGLTDRGVKNLCGGPQIQYRASEPTRRLPERRTRTHTHTHMRSWRHVYNMAVWHQPCQVFFCAQNDSSHTLSHTSSRSQRHDLPNLMSYEDHELFRLSYRRDPF